MTRSCSVLYAAPRRARGSPARAGAGATRSANPLPLVWVLATGGTISGKGATSTSLADYKAGALLRRGSGGRGARDRPGGAGEGRAVANISSTDITMAHWLTLAKRINAIFAADPAVAGVVITHGTNTLEETAYFLNLTVKHDRPVVVVGSMRPASAISADGPLNLLNAVRTAASKEAGGKGTLVVLNDEINAARDATKTNTYRVETFRVGRARPARLRRRRRGRASTARRCSATRRVPSSTSGR